MLYKTWLVWLTWSNGHPNVPLTPAQVWIPTMVSGEVNRLVILIIDSECCELKYAVTVGKTVMARVMFRVDAVCDADSVPHSPVLPRMSLLTLLTVDSWHCIHLPIIQNMSLRSPIKWTVDLDHVAWQLHKSSPQYSLRGELTGKLLVRYCGHWQWVLWAELCGQCGKDSHVQG